jgi:hypothetical protein
MPALAAAAMKILVDSETSTKMAMHKKVAYIG